MENSLRGKKGDVGLPHFNPLGMVLNPLGNAYRSILALKLAEDFLGNCDGAVDRFENVSRLDFYNIPKRGVSEIMIIVWRGEQPLFPAHDLAHPV